MRDFRAEPTITDRLAVIAIWMTFAIALAGCTKKPLPNAYSPQAMLYADRCGQCHAAYNPHTMTADMWRIQVPMMEDKMRQAGLPPLTNDERSAILDYLAHYASK
ncbi:MAG TPA: hypothetical protein VMA09_00940 [Candidatus Binataceae bacterium]|nr:hypothetical protein [Candidatus Binataceae bacterium]